MTTRRVGATERLGRLITPTDTVHAVRKATVETVNADGTVDLRTVEGLSSNVEVGSWYTPQTGDSVRVVQADPFTLFVLGTTHGPAATTVTVTSSLMFPFNVTAVPSGAPSGGSGTLTVPALATRSYRPSDGWSRPDVYQGAYSTGYGYWRGCYFYGAGAASIKGKIVTSATIRVSRASPEGNASNVPQWVAPHAHASQPGSAPVFTANSKVIGYLDWNQALELPISTSWVQRLVNGDARFRGFGHAISSTGANYSKAKSAASDANTGRLTINWRNP